MKPKTKIEKEVARLSGMLPPISDKQKERALELVSYENTHRYHGKPTDIAHFIIVTTKCGWQVLRHYYFYATYRYKKLYETKYAEVMQQWFKDGEYVFMCRNRNGISGYNDSWSLGQPMTIKRGRLGGSYLGDPRDISYNKVYYVRLQKRFSYIPKDGICKNRIDDMFRALNAHPFNETLYKNHRNEWLWSINNDFVFDHERTVAIKIAMRYGYDFMNTEWRDMVEMLQFLGKDLHNPHFVCPADIHTAHNEIVQQAQSKRAKMRRKMERANMIRREAERLRLMEYRAQMEQERKEAEKAAVTLYPKARGKFFGIVITDGEVDIRVLQSVQEFFEEGKEMEHCVFANGYYDVVNKPYSLILSAKHDGKRLETIEVNLKTFEVVQCHGKLNQNTEYHQRILDLMRSNMDLIKAVV